MNFLFALFIFFHKSAYANILSLLKNSPLVTNCTIDQSFGCITYELKLVDQHFNKVELLLKIDNENILTYEGILNNDLIHLNLVYILNRKLNFNKSKQTTYKYTFILKKGMHLEFGQLFPSDHLICRKIKDIKRFKVINKGVYERALTISSKVEWQKILAQEEELKNFKYIDHGCYDPIPIFLKEQKIHKTKTNQKSKDFFRSIFFLPFDYSFDMLKNLNKSMTGSTFFSPCKSKKNEICNNFLIKFHSNHVILLEINQEKKIIIPYIGKIIKNLIYAIKLEFPLNTTYYNDISNYIFYFDFVEGNRLFGINYFGRLKEKKARWNAFKQLIKRKSIYDQFSHDDLLLISK